MPWRDHIKSVDSLKGDTNDKTTPVANGIGGRNRDR